MGREDGTQGPGRTLANKLDQVCNGGPCILYGDPDSLIQYKGPVDYNSLKQFALQHLGPPVGPSPPPSPPSPPSPPPAPPTPPTPPAPPTPPPAPGSEGVYLYEAMGSGKLFIDKSMFTANPMSGRGGAAAWDSCAGASFDNGHPLWTAATGSKVNQFQVKGKLKVRVSVQCGKTHNYPSLDMSRVFSSLDLNATFVQLTYLEIVDEPTPAGKQVTLYEQGGGGKLVLPESKFTANPHSKRGGAKAWDTCGGETFDNGHPIWILGQGSKVGHFEIQGPWRLSVGMACGRTFDYPKLELSRPYSAADGQATYYGLIYLEAAATDEAAFDNATIVV
eukprot:TRINITY_DN12652_c0_g2_i1.p2 TRINITY_DN12652_c0_g2~~TRINITY_DN12652_c0_g2_i1.p2  ORF type:complete len:334 (+),score=73.46 TRINITY_DN12652_c0_g2_i1:281-1282(+)